MFNVLAKYCIGRSFLKWVKLLYTDIVSCLNVNGFLTDLFCISRGVRQGCSLSSLLYVLAIEPFACIRSDPYVKGLHLPGSIDESQIFLFADDSTIIVTDELSFNQKVFTYC